MILLNGFNSTCSILDFGWSTTGNPEWLSTTVSPWPGKCFSVAMTPCCCIALTATLPRFETTSGLSEKERILMTGLLGLLFTSMLGAKLTLMPTDLNECASALYVSAVNFLPSC